jgi:hypothetical protein
MTRSQHIGALFVAALVALGCTGRIGDSGEAGDSAIPRATRLSHAQWENTVNDLLGIDNAAVHAAQFRLDPRQAGFLFDNKATSLEVDQSLWGAYRTAAAELAAQVTADDRVLSALLEGASRDDAGARTFIEKFGGRVHRRPLTPEQVTAYLAIFQKGKTLFADTTGFAAGIRLTLEAMLQSPYFLYRLETSTRRVDGVVPLDGYEIASRLSYFLLNTMPDRALLDRAADGTLVDPATIAAETERLLASPRARDMVTRFHRQLLDVAKYETIAPSAGQFPDAPSTLGQLAAAEHDRFVQDVVLDANGSFADLMTATHTFVNAELARVYGLEGDFGQQLVRAELDPTQRRGLLTQIGFLASNATSVDPDPIHRGVFIARRLACMNIAAPPDDIPPLPPLVNGTNRQRVAGHTEQAGTVCASCHLGIINPLGFPFESFDATGAFRTTDNGQPVDTTASPLVDNTAVPVANAVELATALAKSKAAHACYVKHWLEFAQARESTPADDAVIATLAASSVSGSLSIRDLVVSMVTSRAYTTRSVED